MAMGIGPHTATQASDHRSARPGVPSRAAALGLTTSAISGALSIGAASLARDAAHELGSATVTTMVPVATAVQLLAAALAAVVAGWITVLLLLGALSLAPGHRWSTTRRIALRVAPVWAARVAAVLVCACAGGASAAAAPVPAAAAVLSSPTGSSDPSQVSTQDRSQEPAGRSHEQARGDSEGDQGDRSVPLLEAPEPGWVPLAPPRPATGDVELLSRGHAPVDAVVVVRGDTLWDIAARHLGPGAAVEAVAAEWPRWYAANRALIGPDPDLILPGQLLQPPPPPGGQR